MPWYFILLIILCSLLVIAIIFNVIFTQDLIRPKRVSRKMQDDYNRKHHIYDGLNLLERHDIKFTMRDGYMIHGDYSLVNEKKFVILSHGRGVTREGLVRYACVFQELGYSTIIYDQRGHGDNIRCAITMGKKESKDLNEIISSTYEKFGKDIELGLFGFSMGASSCLLSLQYQQKVSFVVSDCAFSKLSNVVKGVYHKYHLPYYFFFPSGFIYLLLFHHFTLKEDAPYYTIEKNQVPILYIHGGKDDFVKINNLDELYEKTTSYKEKAVFENAGHAHSLASDRARYKEVIRQFLNNISK